MAILVDSNTKLCVSGITGREGTFHSLRNRDYGTQVVAGVTPAKGGQDVDGIPVFNTFHSAVAETGANTAMIFVPPRFAADSILEAEDAGIELIIAITEGIPAHDELRVFTVLKNNERARLVGPNCPGILSPGKANVGIIPAAFFSAGNVGVVSRSGTLTYQIGNVLAQRGFGNSTIVGIGGDPVPGSDFIDIIRLFQDDPETELIVMCGEIGGDAEEQAAEFIESNVTKPVVAYIAGFTAPPGKTMGHAGAIVSGSQGTAKAKAEALESKGVRVGRTPTQVAELAVLTARRRAAVGQFAAASRTLGDMADQISFARGAPSLDIVDVEGLKAAAAEAFDVRSRRHDRLRDRDRLPAASQVDRRAPPGRARERDRHQRLDAGRRVPVRRAGARPGDSVIVERPTYDRTLLSLRNRGADVRMVELEPDGIDVAAVERVLAAGAKPKLAHIIPNFQNPAGYTLSAPKRERLLELARTYEFTVFEDDPYVALRFEGTPLPTMLSMDGDTVVYASSFSKTVCPGIRVGYLVGPTELIARIVKIATNTYISPSMVSQAIVHSFCTSGALEQLDRDRQGGAARARRRRCARHCATSSPTRASWSPRAATSCGSTCRRGTDVGAMFTAAAERDVQFVKGSDFVLEGGESSLRLAYSGVTPEQIEEGVDRLAEAYREATSGVTA